MAADEMALVKEILQVLDDGKAVDPQVLDLRKLTTMADYFVIAHGLNTRQVQALSKDLQERLAEILSLKPHHVEGMSLGHWVLLDYGWVIVHLFLEDKRSYYSLERIWMDAPRVAP